MRSASVIFAVISLAISSGCAEALPSDDSDDENLGVNQVAIVGDNALSPNALNPNALNPNALNPNALNPSALNPNGLSPAALTAISATGDAGDLSRMFVRYAVVCAFKSSQSFAFSWTDSSGIVHNEVYPGHLGIAPSWATKALSKEGKRMVSSCMAAHANYYGVHVLVSLRSGEDPLRLNANSDELDDYSKVEGAFWGNLFDPQPYINACYNGANVDNSRAASRDCAAGHLLSDGTTAECGIVNIVGECKAVCKKYSSSRGYYEDCREQPGVSFKRTDLVITTALP